MTRLIIIQVVYNNKNWIKPVFNSVFNQSFKDFKFVAVIAGSNDGSKELIESEFPEVEIIDPGFNIGFAKGHNLVFEKYCDAEFFQLVNPDLILEQDYIKEMLKAFNDKRVGAATGKLYQLKDLKCNTEDYKTNKIIDTTGVVINKSGRARDRGQHEADVGQYDNSRTVQAISGAGAMYRKSALESIKCWTFTEVFPFANSSKKKCEEKQVLGIKQEYFDEDFHSYWEDVDLSWRMTNKGWKCVFAPTAIGFHGRVAGSSRKGYFYITDFIKHHRNLSERIRQLNFQNHIFMYIKNSRLFYPQFFIRELFMFIYILFFEITTLKILFKMFRMLPKIFKKRKTIKLLATQEFE